MLTSALKQNISNLWLVSDNAFLPNLRIHTHKKKYLHISIFFFCCHQKINELKGRKKITDLFSKKSMTIGQVDSVSALYLLFLKTFSVSLVAFKSTKKWRLAVSQSCKITPTPVPSTSKLSYFQQNFGKPAKFASMCMLLLSICLQKPGSVGKGAK